MDSVGLTPLANAILLCSETAVCRLLKVGADSSIADHGGWNAWHLATRGKRLEVFKRVVESNEAKAMVKCPRAITA